ncbi:MAG: tyrosine-protein phosphatase [Clostridiales bacterium]|jgi:protein-tyrosine phosphatase|nr:tyrosine-protein phosphatase [Clostridiales bacterium]
MVKYKRIPMETLVNVRDLGGYAAKDGKITKYGQFLRSDCPIGISEKDILFLKEYGVTLSIDLRGVDEVESTPSDLAGLEGHTYRHCPISREHSVLKSKDEKNRAQESVPPGENFDLGDSYIEIAETAKPWVKQVFELCAEWDGGVLFHCFIGKDRVGIISAILLGACGVSAPDIMMDYSASMSCLRPKYNTMNTDFLPQKRGRPDYSWGFFGSVPESMEALLCHLNEKYGDIPGYLKDCGVTEDLINMLREKLLEDVEQT